MLKLQNLLGSRRWESRSSFLKVQRSALSKCLLENVIIDDCNLYQVRELIVSILSLCPSASYPNSFFTHSVKKKKKSSPPEKSHTRFKISKSFSPHTLAPQKESKLKTFISETVYTSPHTHTNATA